MTHPSGSVLENLETFYETWLDHQQAYLQQLHLAATLQTHDKEEKQVRLIKQVLAHYQQYYDEKSKAAGEDVFHFISAPWLSSYERALLWISGIKPSIVFRLLDPAVEDLSAAQALRMQVVKADIRRKEREIMEAMASLQESVAAPPILVVARQAGRLMDGEICEMDNAMEELKTAMVGVLERADILRGSMMKRVMEIMNPQQMVKLLAAAAEFQLRIRRWGVQRDSQNSTGSS